MPPKRARTGAAKPPGTTGAPGAPAFPGAVMPFKKGGGRKKAKPKPAAGGK